MVPIKMNSVKRKKIRLCLNDSISKSYAKPKVKSSDNTYLVKESLQTNNKDLARALQESKFECKRWFEEVSSLKKENMVLQQEILHLNGFKKNLTEIKEYLASSVSLLLDVTDNLRNAMVLSNSLSSASVRINNSQFEYNFTPQEPVSSKATPRLRAVHPMVSGFTVQKPNVSLVRIDINQGRASSRNGSTRLTSIAASPSTVDSETNQLRNEDIEVDQDAPSVDLDPLEGTSSTYQNFSALPAISLPPVSASVSNLSNNTCQNNRSNYPPLVQLMEDPSANSTTLIDAEDMELTGPVLSCDVVKSLLAQAKFQSPVASHSSPHRLSLISENISSSGRNVLSVKNYDGQFSKVCSPLTPCRVLCTDIYSKNPVENVNEEDYSNRTNYKCDIVKNSRVLKGKTKTYEAVIENGDVEMMEEDSDSDEWVPDPKVLKKRTQSTRVPSKSRKGLFKQADIYEFSSPVEVSPRVVVRQLHISGKKSKALKSQDSTLGECSVSVINGGDKDQGVDCDLGAITEVSLPPESAPLSIDSTPINAGDIQSDITDVDAIPMVTIHSLPKLNCKRRRGGHSSDSQSRRSSRVNLAPGAFTEPSLNKKLRQDSGKDPQRKKSKR